MEGNRKGKANQLNEREEEKEGKEEQEEEEEEEAEEEEEEEEEKDFAVVVAVYVRSKIYRAISTLQLSTLTIVILYRERE